MNMTAKALCLGLIFGLSACGPLYEDSLGSNFLGRLQGQLGGGTPAIDPATAIPAAVANAGPGEVLLVTILNRNAVAPLTIAQRTPTTTTWISPGKVTMAFEGPILVGTRGLPDDLMGVDPIGVRAALNAGGGTAQRRQSFLTSEDQIVTRTLTCQITRTGSEEIALINGPRTVTKFEEVCEGPALIFTNLYWMAGGQVIRSRQAVSAGVGFIQVDQL